MDISVDEMNGEVSVMEISQINSKITTLLKY